jgi:membrane associated rhomboid family serine protease
MVRKEYRIVLASLGVFVAITGLFAAIHGLLFDQERVLRYGAAAAIAGVASFVLFLNPSSNLDDDR